MSLSRSLLTLAVAGGFVASAFAETTPARPNIVFIFSDDHAYQAISAYGDPRKLLDTPNLDRIPKGGMRFDRCLVPNSICGPSRATVLTGIGLSVLSGKPRSTCMGVAFGVLIVFGLLVSLPGLF